MMRSFAAVLILAGLIGFVYCSIEKDKYEPVPEATETLQTLKYPAGRLELGRYAAALAGAIGVLLALFPKGR
jgi:hypothetical protein